jgi:hypothetical protein
MQHNGRQVLWFVSFKRVWRASIWNMEGDECCMLDVVQGMT